MKASTTDPRAVGHCQRPFSSLSCLMAVGKDTVRGWSEHHDLRFGASLAYYTVFSIAPLFLIALAIAGFWFGDEAASRQLFGQIKGLVGSEGSEAIQAMVASADRPRVGMWASIVAGATLCIGATGVFIELQNALNAIWQVRRKPGTGLRYFIKARLLSFAMVLSLGFLLLVSLIISAGLAAVGKFLSGLMPGEELVWQGVNFVISFGLIALLYAFIFKWLPDVKVAWRDVWLAAICAALLFNIGKFALGYYLGRGSVTSVYGAAGSLVVILLWVYYSSQTLFLGAEFTRAQAHHAGRNLQPERGAEFVAVKAVKSPDGKDPG